MFCSQQVKSFNVPITYYINDRPFTFLVQAQADPVSLELSTKILRFAFTDDSNDTEMSVKQTLEVTNQGNAPAKFSWENISKIYVPSPLSDIVPPGESRKVTVVFNPPGPRVDEETLTMKIEDGAEEELRCVGAVNESKCIFLEKMLNFGNTHVGIRTKDQTITIKNQMRTSAVFNVENDDSEMMIQPRKGRI